MENQLEQNNNLLTNENDNSDDKSDDREIKIVPKTISKEEYEFMSYISLLNIRRPRFRSI